MGLTEHGIRLDEEREARLGFDEAIYAAGKSTEQLDALVADALARGQRRLFTRLSVEQAALLRAEHRAALDHDPISRTAVVGAPRPLAARIAVGVLAAGSSDLPVASEARRTLEYHGQAALQITDVGVAGLWRLLERLDELRRLSILIVAAGMEGALFSVVGGLLPGVVIALPTSVGYGVSAGGRTALGSALASCAPGIVTVNIDNGYGAACAALRMLRVAAGD